MAVELVSFKHKVECAAVVRSPRASAADMVAPTKAAPPQFTMIRCPLCDNSNASVEAQPDADWRASGGGPASSKSTDLPADTR